MTGGPSRRDLLRLGAGALAGAALAGCADTAADSAPVVASSGAPYATPTERSTPAEPPAPKKPAVKGNPYGVIPVLMHHRLVSGDAGEYDMTPAYFRAELERLHRERYHPIRTIDLVRRNFAAVPPGKTPVVLTFDDGTPGQFAIDAAGRIDPGCAVGILLAFHAEHPDFPAVASFYVNKNPFGYAGAAARRALVRLHSLGCEIGNHTLDHADLRTSSHAEIQAEIGGLAALLVQTGVPAPRTIALPFGARPRDRAVLASGGSGATAYRNEGVLLVGANPSPSPYDRAFDPMSIPRIRCSSHDGGRGEFEMTYWLDRLAKRPGQRFVAGGAVRH